VGTSWQVLGFGNFGSLGGTDMILHDSSTGGLEVYNIRNNQIIGANFMGTVGVEWQFSGVGNFSSRGTSDMLLRNSNTGALQVYDINSNQITGTAFMGSVGTEWQFSGVGNFSGVAGETDLLLRNSNTGGLQVYDISNNRITGAAFLGMVGLDWQYAGIAAIHAAGASDLVLRNANSGAFEVYILRATRLSEPPAWARSGWIGRSVVLLAIQHPHRRHPWATRTPQPLSSCKRWRGLAAAAAARSICRIPPPSLPTPRNSRSWRRLSTYERAHSRASFGGPSGAARKSWDLRPRLPPRPVSSGGATSSVTVLTDGNPMDEA
jgi:hypothetical protein